MKTINTKIMKREPNKNERHLRMPVLAYTMALVARIGDLMDCLKRMPTGFGKKRFTI